MKTTRRKILSLLLCLTMLLSLLPAGIQPAQAETAEDNDATTVSEWNGSADISWYNEEDTTFILITAAQLAGLAKLVNEGKDFSGKTITLDVDIDLNPGYTYDSETGKWTDNSTGEQNSLHEWTAIGTDSSHTFNGTFNGNNKTISGLYINDNSADNQGLFGYLDGGIVQNLTVSGEVTANDYVGGVVGWNSGGKVINCTNNGNVTAKGSGSYVGGVVGRNTSGNVTECTNSGTVTAQGSSSEAGGVVGRNYNGCNVTNCTNSGNVTVEGGGSYVGGVIGENNDTVTTCTNTDTGKVTAVGNDTRVGGVIGYNNEGVVENCANSGTVTAEGGSSKTGGVVGDNTVLGKIINCYNTGAVTATGEDVGGVVGSNNDGTVTGCYFLKDTASSGSGSGSNGNAAPLSADEFANSNNFQGWDFDKTWIMNPLLGRPVLQANPEGGDGTEKNPYEIDNADKLKAFANIINGTNNQTSDSDACAILIKNIDLSSVCGEGKGESGADVSWTPIGTDYSHPFTGTFEGNNYTINGLYINNSADYQGLFGYVGSGGTVQNSTVSGKVTANNYVGGVVGYNNGGNIISCTNNVTITDTAEEISSSVGGVVGDNTGGNVISCTNNVTVTTVEDRYSYVGGVVGRNDKGNVKNCNNTDTGTVIAEGSYSSVGGIVGLNFSGTVTNCTNGGTITGKGSASEVGGVVGDSDGNVANCTNNGTVKAKGSDFKVGGVVGYNFGNVTNCTNTDISTVTAEDDSSYVGGVVGYNDDSTVKNCYYLKNTTSAGVGNETDNTGAAEKNKAEFASGEVAWLLQHEQDDDAGQVWGQRIGTDEYPVLTVFGKDALKVYKVTFMNDTSEFSAGYANTGGSVGLPTDNPEAAAGQNFVGWFSEESGGTQYESPISVTSSDVTAYAHFAVQAPEAGSGYTIDYAAETATAESGYEISIDGTKYSSGPIAITPGGTLYVRVSGSSVATSNSISARPTLSDTVSGGVGSITGVTSGMEYRVVGSENWTSITGTSVTNLAAGDYEVRIAATNNSFASASKIVTVTAEQPSTPSRPTTPSEPEQPSGPSTGDSEGWDDIRDEIAGAEDGDTITIDMNGETEVPAEIFEEVAGKDVTIKFDLGDGVTWEVKGTDIPADANFSDLDLGVSMNTSGIPVNVINAITGEMGTVQITLAHDGAFGFVLTLTAPLGEENAGYWANLYHYDEDAETLNFETAAEIADDGTVRLRLTHASQYAIVIDDHSHAPAETTPVADLFTDVAPDAWYIDAVQYAYDQGLMTGTSAATFEPNISTTRGMIVSILYRLEESPDISDENLGYPFADVDASAWYADPVYWARMNGIVAGFEDNTFGPNKPITREQLAAILYNYAQWKGMDVSARTSLDAYTDQPSEWAEEVMQWAVAEGLISGTSATTLDPQGSATRAQVAAILERFLEN